MKKRSWLFRKLFPKIARREDAIAAKQKIVDEALQGYPPYEPPHRDWMHNLLQTAAEANFDHLIESRPARLKALSDFLAKFGVKPGTDEAGLEALSKWIAEYGGFLTSDFRDEVTEEVYFGFSEPWTGRWLGLNVVFDLGIFLGEAMIARKRKIRWARMGNVYLAGVTGGKLFDPFRAIYIYCDGVAGAYEFGAPVGNERYQGLLQAHHHRAKPDTFARYVNGISR